MSCVKLFSNQNVQEIITLTKPHDLITSLHAYKRVKNHKLNYCWFLIKYCRLVIQKEPVFRGQIKIFLDVVVYDYSCISWSSFKAKWFYPSKDIIRDILSLAC